MQLTAIGGWHASLRVLAGAVAWFVVVPTVALGQPASRAAATMERDLAGRGTVAVAPFVNISAEATDDWIGAGIAETVSADLESLDEISVVGRDALIDEMAAAASDRPPAGGGDAERAVREAGRRLGAAWVVTGGYQRLGDRVRITARLVDTTTGALAAGVKADGAVGDLFALQDRVVAELSAAFHAAADGGHFRPPGLLAGNGNGGNGNGSGAFGGVPRFMPPGGSARPARLRPADVAGEMVLGERGRAGTEGMPSAGLAAAAGILTGRPTLRPTRTEVRPDIDGLLDDLVWRNALRVTEFVQESPLEGAPATEDTEVWISYDSQNLYVAVHAHYEDPGIMRGDPWWIATSRGATTTSPCTSTRSSTSSGPTPCR